jgi:pyruvate decarboxylase
MSLLFICYLNNVRLTICKLCEIFMDKFDYPWRLSKQLEIARARMKEAAGKANITAG